LTGVLDQRILRITIIEKRQKEERQKDEKRKDARPKVF